jgi:hypothetical protein
MTARFSFIIAAIGAALVVAVPAFGQGQPVEPQWMQALEARSQELNRAYGLGDYSPAIRALKLRSEALNKQYGLGAYSASAVRIMDAQGNPGGQVSTTLFRDAHERLPDVGQQVSTISPDVFERAVAARDTSSGDRFIANDNRFRVEPGSRPATVAATGSGTDIEWPQVGIGLGVGIALMLGLVFGLRVTRHRPLAH